MRTLLVLFLLQLTSAKFYMKLDKNEKCLADNFVKNQEAILRFEIQNFDPAKNFEITVKLRNPSINHTEMEKFSFKNEEKRSFIYTHHSDEEVSVCISSTTEVYATVKLTVNIELPDSLIQKDDVHELENMIYKSVTSMADFNRVHKNLGTNEESNLTVT